VNFDPRVIIPMPAVEAKISGLLRSEGNDRRAVGMRDICGCRGRGRSGHDRNPRRRARQYATRRNTLCDGESIRAVFVAGYRMTAILFRACRGRYPNRRCWFCALGGWCQPQIAARKHHPVLDVHDAKDDDSRPANVRNRRWNPPVAKLDIADNDKSAGRVPTENANIVSAPVTKLAFART